MSDKGFTPFSESNEIKHFTIKEINIYQGLIKDVHQRYGVEFAKYIKADGKIEQNIGTVNNIKDILINIKHQMINDKKLIDNNLKTQILNKAISEFTNTVIKSSFSGVEV